MRLELTIKLRISYKMTRLLILLMLSFNLLVIEVYAQEEDYDDEHITSSLPNFSSFNINPEFYQFNSNESAYYLVSNGTFEFGNSDYLNIELVGAYYTRDGDQDFTLGDFSVTYAKNFYSKKHLSSGFQGITPSLKVIMPTGNPDFAGLFGYWIAEPSLYYSWLLKNEKLFFSNRWRAFLPAIEAKDAAEPPLFIRFEPRFGYENKKFWASVTLDNRYIINQEEFVLFYRLDGTYKLNESSGLTLFYTERIYNSVLFQHYTGLSFYYIF